MRIARPFGLHMRLIEHPARAVGLERLLDHIARHKDVWITRRVDIAHHWMAAHPYPGKGLNEQRASTSARLTGRIPARGGCL